MPPASTTVIVGAGAGGVVVARRLRRLLGPEHRILVVDHRAEISFPPAYLDVVLGKRRPEQITRQLARLERFGLEFRCAEAVAVDPARRAVEIAGDRVPADAIVLAPGARLAPEKLPGAAGVAHGFYELDAALRLGEALRNFGGGRILVAVASTPYRCPAAPHEAVLVLDHMLRRRGASASVSFVTPEPRPLPVAGPTVGSAVLALHAERGITARFGARPVRVHSPTSVPAGTPPSSAVPGELELEDGSREPFDLLVLVPPHAAPGFLATSGLLGQNGWVSVDRATLATSFDGIWAIGDVTHVPLANGGMLPKAAVFARGEGEVVAREIAARLASRAERMAFDGRGGCFLETGGGLAAFAQGEFFAEPDPRVEMSEPSRKVHWRKRLFEWESLRAWY